MTNFCWLKKNKVWLPTVVNSHQAGILKWTLGHRDLETFRHLWFMIRGWHCFLYITDGYPVYPCLINDGDHLVSQIAMTRVEGENSRLRHYLARLHRQTFCYSKSLTSLRASLKLVIYYLKHQSIPIFC